MIVTVVHVEAGEAVVAPPAGEAVAVGGGVFLVHKDAGDAAGAAAQVFVAAPDRLCSPVSTGRHPYHNTLHNTRQERDIQNQPPTHADPARYCPPHGPGPSPPQCPWPGRAA